MATRFSRLFHEWDDHTDISMVELGAQENGEDPGSPRSIDLSRRQSDNSLISSQTLPPYDDASTRSLLRTESWPTTTGGYESLTSPADGTKEPRHRHGFRANVRQLLPKPSFLTHRTNSTFDGNFAHGKPGWWKKQMLVDRSLRSMAVFTATCAVIMFIIIFSYLKDFMTRLNTHTTSVGGSSGESCSEAESRNVAVHLFINIAATMILGCSNTYQQLVTALKVDEIRWVMSKRGDSKVGTNSPWSINHKREGKTKAWLAWILLISTSIPVHFLANSVIGPSFYIQMPTTITYTPIATEVLSNYYYSGSTYYGPNADDSACWTAFRANAYVLPKDINLLDQSYNTNILGNSTTYASVEVQYTSNCTQYLKNTDVTTALAETSTTIYPPGYTVGNCIMGLDVTCKLSDPQARQCRMNVRMQAAFILGSCLLIKAIYMIILNFRARHSTKNHCLTYGDVLVASVLDPELKIQNECLLNSGDGYRVAVKHTCHKHCKDPVPSITGDTIGHCQKCKKFNETNMAADLPHPSIAIKYKRSLLSNLGSTAITQMLILMFSSLAMLAVSIMLLVSIGSTISDYNQKCTKNNPNIYGIDCSQTLGSIMKARFGTWGGFSSSVTLSSLPADSIGSEFIAFAISNGAQFIYSLLYLLLIYNLTLISMEHEWGNWELKRRRPRCTIVSGRAFEQSYFLQLPSKILLPLMGYASLMHWLLGQAISATETIYTDPEHGIEHSLYFVTYAAYPIFFSTILMVAMTVVCWWAFTYTREGFIPQMYGSIRTCCASTTELTDFSHEGILWGDLGMGEKFRHAGFTSDEPANIVPAELYCGRK